MKTWCDEAHKPQQIQSLILDLFNSLLTVKLWKKSPAESMTKPSRIPDVCVILQKHFPSVFLIRSFSSLILNDSKSLCLLTKHLKMIIQTELWLKEVCLKSSHLFYSNAPQTLHHIAVFHEWVTPDRACIAPDSCLRLYTQQQHANQCGGRTISPSQLSTLKQHI